MDKREIACTFCSCLCAVILLNWGIRYLKEKKERPNPKADKVTFIKAETKPYSYKYTNRTEFIFDADGDKSTDEFLIIISHNNCTSVICKANTLPTGEKKSVEDWEKNFPELSSKTTTSQYICPVCNHTHRVFSTTTEKKYWKNRMEYRVDGIKFFFKQTWNYINHQKYILLQKVKQKE